MENNMDWNWFVSRDHISINYKLFCPEGNHGVREYSQLETIKTEITITAETTGKFIEVSPDTLDYAECVFTSVYQLSFMVCNKATIPHGVGIKFPSCLKSYLSASENDVYISPNASERITIRFIPRKEIVFKNEITYYNRETKILEFPVYVSLTSKNDLDVPPTKLKIFAVLTDPNDLSLHPILEDHVSCYYKQRDVNLQQCRSHQEGAEYFLDLGQCTIYETIYATIEMVNNSFVFQNYGFLDLPKMVQMSPNYGFGEIAPLDIKRLTLTFSPEKNDISGLETETPNYIVKFPVTVSTIKSIGGVREVKKLFKYQYIRHSASIMEKELERKFTNDLLEEMQNCLNILKTEEVFQLFKSFSENQSSTTMFHDEMNRSSTIEVLTSPMEELKESNTLICNNIWVKATIVEPLCELSHQYIEFPDTPCGSYSIMNITLCTLDDVGDVLCKCVCGYAKKHSVCKKHTAYSVDFEIIGNNKEITIDQTCGRLEKGQEVTLTLLAKPQLSQDITKETAKELKREKLLLEKRLEWERKNDSKLKVGIKGKASKGKGEKKGKVEMQGKPDKKGKKVDQKISDTKDSGESKRTSMPEFVVNDDEIVLDLVDMYPAEMVAWKNMEPYLIEASFCCLLTYDIPDIVRKPDKLYFTAMCKVIRPDFVVVNLNSQHIDFGLVTVGMTTRKIVSIQNIQYEPRNPTITLLNPTGCFTCPPPRNLVLPPQHILHLPLKFSPLHGKEMIEYFEIKAGKTICPLVVSGTGVDCRVVINPNFVVCRLEANIGGFVDCPIEINNPGNAVVTIEFIKTCELVGEIKPMETKSIPKKDGLAENGSKTKGKQKPASPKNKKDASSKVKISKFSEDLNEDEKFSLKNYFTHKQGESYFEILGTSNNIVDIGPLSKAILKIHFGVPLPPELKGKDKRTKSPTQKASKSSAGGPKMYYVAKFNIMLGKTKLLRDVIILATFI